MGKLIITRSSEFNNAMRKFRIYLNGEKIGTISSGEVKELGLAPEGTHNIRAKIDWCGSKNFSFNMKNEETKSITISGFKFGSILMILAPFIIIFPILFRDFIKSHLILKIPILIIASFVTLVLMYYLTIGRKKYLEIEEISEQTK